MFGRRVTAVNHTLQLHVTKQEQLKDQYSQNSLCVYVGVKVLHAACIILYTCKSSLYFILVFFFGSSL